MQKLFFVVVLCISSIFAEQYEVVQNENGQEFYMVPLVRERRSPEEKASNAVKYGIGGDGSRTYGTVGLQGTLYDNGNHKIDATPFVTKYINNKDIPLITGGTVKYTHIPTDAKLSVTGQHTGSFGNQLGITASKTLWKNNQGTSLDAYAGWERNYGGLIGTTHPQWGAGIQLNQQIPNFFN